MVFAKTIAAGLIAATALTAVPASAASVQFNFGPYWGPHVQERGWRQDRGWHDRWQHQRVSTHQVRRMLQGRGYYRIRFVDRGGPVYQVRADKRGRSFFLVINARTGEILRRHRA
jgi:hypothetical protein